MSSSKDAKPEERIPTPMEVGQKQQQQVNAPVPEETTTKESHAIRLDAEQCVKIKTNNYHSHVREIKKNGLSLRSDWDQPKLIEKPTWFDEDLFKNAQSVYARHFMGIMFAHLAGLLILVRVDSIFRTLNATGQSSTVAKLFKRYYQTLKHVKSWYEGDIFDDQHEAYRSLLIVRGMHNKVATKFNDAKTNSNPSQDGGNKMPGKPSDGNGVSRTSLDENHNSAMDDERLQANKAVHISEYDVMITQYAFVGFIVMNATSVGLLDNFSTRDLESLLHFWRVIGYYLGASDKFNLCAYELDDTIGLCKAFRDIEYLESMAKSPLSEPPGLMSLNIIRSVKFTPLLTIYGMMRYIYELLGQDTKELEHKRNWYSHLSYTLIKLVMTRILAYKPMRSFNNGIFRLSIFLVGKVQDWFSRRLESQYGPDLKY